MTTYTQLSPKLPWAWAQQWLCRMFPKNNCGELKIQTVSINWLKIHRRCKSRQSKVGEKAYLDTAYEPPSPKMAPEPSPPSDDLPTEKQHEESIEELLKRKHDSPTKKKYPLATILL